MELSFPVNLQPISNQYELNFPVSFHGASEVFYENPHKPLSWASASWLYWTVRNAVELSCRRYFWKQNLPFLHLLLYFSFNVIPDILSDSKRKAQAVCLQNKGVLHNFLTAESAAKFWGYSSCFSEESPQSQVSGWEHLSMHFVISCLTV